uniref:Uncharacterized protein LOC104237141 n=1 Tax=Nicotiana sylvestris TaxID=4096 RepID=A0A1U7XIS0_NICSY|nr:PREDICTED: uncharacterized protein LOC104237141 [Nicotiana sylvestris]
MRSNPNRRNPDFLCEFHNDHGHKTTDWRLLQGEVEHLLKQGYLTEFFNEKGKQAYMKNRQEPLKPASLKRTVNVISGGEKINGVTCTVAKKVSKITVTHGKRVHQVLEEDSIIFDDTDVDGVMTPHNNALVSFLGFLVSNCGIEVNLAQIKVIEEIPDILTSKKEVQMLTVKSQVLADFSPGMVAEVEKELQVKMSNPINACENDGLEDHGENGIAIPGSSANVIRSKVVEQLGLLDQIIPTSRVLNGFNMAGEATKGEITLSVNVSEVVQDAKFHVTDGDMRYNTLLGRPWIHDMREVLSNLYQMMRFPTKDGTKIVYGE